MQMTHRFFTLLLGTLALSPAGARDNDPDDWVPCAREGQTCYVPGPAQVRFGSYGQFAVRNVDGRIDCERSEFGESARRRPRMCEYRLGWDPALPQPERPGHFGAGPEHRWPPAPPMGGAPGRFEERGPASQWTHCADEGSTCTTSQPTVIRYGVPGDHHYRQLGGSIRCDGRLFGDPKPGVQKTCDINTMPVNRAQGRQPDADEIPPLDDRFWTECARESQECRFRGPAHVRYGANGLYRVMSARDGLTCDSRSFGGDPTPNTRKTCAIYRP